MEKTTLMLTPQEYDYIYDWLLSELAGGDKDKVIQAVNFKSHQFKLQGQKNKLSAIKEIRESNDKGIYYGKFHGDNRYRSELEFDLYSVDIPSEYTIAEDFGGVENSLWDWVNYKRQIQKMNSDQSYIYSDILEKLRTDPTHIIYV